MRYARLVQITVAFFIAAALSRTAARAQTCDPAVGEAVPLHARSFLAPVRVHDLYWDGSFSTAEYPVGSGVSPLYAGGFWVGARRSPDDSMVVAAQSYGRVRGEFDFAAGAFDPATGEPADDRSFCSPYGITRAQIDAHLLDLADGSLDDLIDAILAWPGRGNPHGAVGGFYATDLAPFVDVDGDGLYDATAGDYPDVRGE